jgi:hypothetical protein
MGVPGRLTMHYGCEDCGRVWHRKVNVPVECQPFTFIVERSENALGGYAFTDDDPPCWDGERR